MRRVVVGIRTVRESVKSTDFLVFLSHACWTVSCFAVAWLLNSFLPNDTSNHSSLLARYQTLNLPSEKTQDHFTLRTVSPSFPFAKCSSCNLFPEHSFHWALHTRSMSRGRAEGHHGRRRCWGDSSPKQLFWRGSLQVWYWAHYQQGLWFEMQTAYSARHPESLNIPIPPQTAQG